MSKNVWVSGPAASGMSGSPFVQRNFRVEVPAYGIDESIIFSTAYEAQECARDWSKEDRILVLIWDFKAAMYVARYDGREVPHPSSWNMMRD